MATPLILDTDIGGDVDDALALALCVRHPEIDLRAVTTVSGDAPRRARIAARLLQLAECEDVEVAAGRSGPLPVNRADPDLDGSEAAMGVWEREVSPRDAVDLLVDECRRAPITVATVGPQSNVAAALGADEGFAASVGRLAVMGGVFAPIEADGHRWEPSIDYNLNVDCDASVRSLNAGLPTLYVPCDVTFGTYLTSAHVDRLRQGDPLCHALADLIDIWTPQFRRLHPGAPDDHVAMMHDPLAVAAVVDGSFVTVEPMPVTVAVLEDHARTFIDPLEGTVAEVVRSVDAEAFADWWLDVVCGV